MKRIVSLLLAVFLGVLLGGCTQASKEPGRLFLIKEKGKYGYIDRTGRVVIPPQFKDAGNFSEGLARVRLSEKEPKYGYIDTSGKVVISPQFEIAGEFHEGLAWVGSSWGGGPNCGFIDRTGKMVIPAKYFGYSGDFSEGLASVCDEQKIKIGFIDNTGNMVIPPQFDCYYMGGKFTEGLAAASVDKKLYGYIDKTGKMVIPPQYYRAVKFSEGLAAVQAGEEEGSSTWGFINKTGKMVVQPQFYLPLDLSEGEFTNYCGVFSGGLAEVWQDPDTAGYGRVGYIDHTGKFVWIEKNK